MEIKINKEIMTYEETIFFGLTMRQFLCSALAVGTAVGLYLLLSPVLGRESVSWICILGAIPFAAAGFFRYNGMYFEQFAWAVIETLLRSRPRGFEAENYFYECCKGEDKHD